MYHLLKDPYDFFYIQLCQQFDVRLDHVDQCLRDVFRSVFRYQLLMVLLYIDT